MVSSKSRLANLELLRIVLTMMVISLHYNNASMGGALGYVTKGTVNYYVLLGIECFCVAAVNCFLILFGYFNIYSKRCNLQKPVKLICMVIIYNVFFYFARLVSKESLLKGHIVMQEAFNIKYLLRSALPVNYYVILYCVVLILSPFVNKLIEGLDRDKYKMLLSIGIILFSIWNLSFDLIEKKFQVQLYGINTVGAYGDQYGYTIVNFILMYMIGGYIRKYGKEDKLAWLKFLLISIVLLICVLYSELFLNYNCVLVIIESVYLFKIFQRIRIANDNCACIINKIASTTFGIYLTHIYFRGIWYNLKMPEYCSGDLLGMILNYLVSVICMFILCACISAVFNKLIFPLLNKCTSTFNKEISA